MKNFQRFKKNFIGISLKYFQINLLDQGNLHICLFSEFY